METSTSLCVPSEAPRFNRTQIVPLALPLLAVSVTLPANPLVALVFDTSYPSGAVTVKSAGLPVKWLPDTENDPAVLTSPYVAVCPVNPVLSSTDTEGFAGADAASLRLNSSMKKRSPALRAMVTRAFEPANAGFHVKEYHWALPLPAAMETSLELHVVIPETEAYTVNL